MVNRGFRLVRGSWKIMAISLPRISRSSRLDSFVSSLPPSSRWFACTVMFLGVRPMMDRLVILLPQPDSPTMPSSSPLRTWKDTSRTGCSTRSSVLI